MNLYAKHVCKLNGLEVAVAAVVLCQSRPYVAQRPQLWRGHVLALSQRDCKLLDRCLSDEVRAWEDFVDRYKGLVVHVIDHTARCRLNRLSSEDREDLAVEIFTVIVRDDMAVLRNFRGASSMATYLTVIARRIAVPALIG